MTELSVLFVNYNSWRVLAAALASLRAHPPTRRDGTPMPFEVIVVDNASPQRDPEAEAEVRVLLAGLGGELVMHHENGGYAKGMNLAYARSRGRWLLVSNPDVLFTAGCIDRLLRFHEAVPECGAAAPEGFFDRGLTCKLPPNILPTLGDLVGTTLANLFPVWNRWYSRRRTRAALRVWEAEESVELDMLSGCCFLMERALIGRIGLFDERFPLYYEDTDLSVRIRKAGRRIHQVAGARLVHLYNRSGQTDHALAMARYWVSRRLYYRKWYGPLGGWLIDLAGRVLGSRWGKARAARNPHRVWHDLGASHDKPVLRLPRPARRFAVELALDPKFFLAAAAFGSGDGWTPSDALFRNFGPTTYWFRVVDLGGRRPRELAVYRCTLLYPSTATPEPVEEVHHERA